MTQQNKELLIKDLCARLPYGVWFKIGENPIKIYDYVNGKLMSIDIINELVNDKYYIEDIKPYLFPMSAMTEKQREEITKTIVTIDEDCNIIADEDIWSEPIKYKNVSKYIDWLNVHYFDYRGLIDKGLAIDATNLNIY